MSNIFAPYCRWNRRVPLTIGTGPIDSPIEHQHLRISDEGQIHAAQGTIIHHYGDALPFDVDGRLVIGYGDIVKWDQGIPFTAAGYVAVQEDVPAWFDQGVGFTATGHMAIGIEGAILPGEYFKYYPEDPGDFTLPLSDLGFDENLEQDFAVQAVYIPKEDFVNIPEFHIWHRLRPSSQDVNAGYRFPTRHGLGIGSTVQVSSNSGAFLDLADYPVLGKLQGEICDFRYATSTGDLRAWLDVANQDDGTGFDETLIFSLNEIQHVSTYWRLLALRIVTPRPDDATVLAWPEYTAPLPVWSTVPDQFNWQYELPDTLDITPYVSGNITGFSLVTPPAGFTIDGNGVVTCDGAAVANHSITVRATSSDFTTADTTFEWVIELGNAPVWTPIPDQSHRENELPKTLDIKPYVASDSGPILDYLLVTPPAGFSISGGVITAAAGTVVAAHGITVRATNGVGASETSFTWNILEELVGPQWSTIPDQLDIEPDLPVTLDASAFVTSNAGALRNWALVTPPPGFSIDQTGLITVAAGTALSAHNIVVQVENDIGNASTGFIWTISAQLLPPQWSVIPGKSTGENLLPSLYDVSGYASSNSGPLTGWALVTPPAGFSINANGVITAANTLAPGTYQLTVEVTNDTGTSQSAAFTWEIELFYLVPQWSVIPAQSTGDLDLPVAVDISSYVTSNSGPLVNWSLVTPPTGFSISQSGVITVAAGTAITTHSVTVRVENDEGPADSAAFSWQIFDTPEAPSWSNVPDQSHGEDNLPQTLDMKGYVTSNSGPLTGWQLVSPVTGFSIDANGVLTLADGTAPNPGYSLQVQVTNDTGTTVSNIFSWEVGSVYLVPQWSTIPAQATEEQLLPVVLDVKPYVTTNHGPLTNWSLVSPPGGWTIDSNGIITVAAARPVGSNQITVRVSNDSGSADSVAFDWDILEEPLPPQWNTILNKQTRENLLPTTYDVSGFVSTNSGPLTGWMLVSPPAGFTISGAGVITAAAGTAVAVHSLTVRVSNDTGTEDSSSFLWEIQEELLPPQWDTVPDRSDRINTLPQTYDMSFYVTSNSGSLILWELVSAPAGFSINASSGVITATAAAGVGDHSLRVQVTNSTGTTQSNIFQWEILEELLPPQWQTIPNRTDTQDSLPQDYDVSSYVTTNDGAITYSLVSPPANFVVDGGSGVVTAQSGASVADHSITVRATNNSGGSDKTFTWTIDPPAVKQYFHEFNATLDTDFWTFQRSGNQTGMDNTTIRRQVVGGVPVYPSCGWSGSSFTPNAGFRGILLEPAATNRFWWSTKFFPSNETSWRWNGGWGTKSPVNQGRESSMNQVPSDSSQTATHTWDARSDDGAGRDIGFSNDNGGAITWYTMPDGTYAQMQHVQAPRGEQVCTMSNRHNNQSWSYDWWQLETGIFGTSQIETFGATGSRNQTKLDGDLTSFFDPAEMTQDWAMQIKFSMENAISTAPAAAWGICTITDKDSPSTTNYGICYLGSTYIAFNIRVGGADHNVVFSEAGVAGIQRLDEIDLRIKWTSTGLTAWLKYPGQALYKKTTATALSAWPQSNFAFWGLRLEQNGPSVNDMPGCLKAVRIEAPAPSDAEVEGWT